jgi:hypothetical protein
MESLNLSRLNLIQWGLLALFALAGIYLLIKAATIIQTYDVSKDRQRKVQKSVLTGFYGVGFWFCCILAILTVLWANLGLRSAAYISLIIGGCTLPLMFIVCVVGVFIQLNWTDRIKGTLDTISEQELRRRNG